MSTSPILHSSSSKGQVMWCGRGALLLAVLLTGCASEGWKYYAPPKGTYSLSVDGARNNPPGANGYITDARKPTYHEYRYGQPTGRTFEAR